MARVRELIPVILGELRASGFRGETTTPRRAEDALWEYGVSDTDSAKARWASRRAPRLDEIALAIAERRVIHEEFMERVDARYGDLIAALDSNSMTDEFKRAFAEASHNDRGAMEWEVLQAAYLRWSRRQPRSREEERRKRERRRASMAATADGTWPHWRQLIDEDGPACALCGDDVEPGSDSYGRRPSVDHIEPLFFGGQHRRANAQLAHFACNSDKAAGIG